MKALALSAILTLAFSAAGQSAYVPAREAKNHVGESTTVCGLVASARYAAQSKGEPTFLNFDEPYPHEVFTAVIWGSDREKFAAPEATYRGKTVCVTGKVSSYRGTPEIILRDPEQIKVKH